ncbi:hypothetical protein DSO57_1015669 [Entomophthora muscae]|uniref:Uncharacterized protein n=1 Tax=Entomophthora muscae TaxID=34485 RepID=A0ACC2UQX2_9FUNG|nr:hypothetical protein DSO57_1015669 [Entomophthora muscae]
MTLPMSKGGPGFLYVGGESSIGEYLVKSGLAVDLATEHNGVLYALEHRYYGKSQPFETLSVANLKYLSASQALEDLACFAKNIRHRPSKWFLIGGSYPGNLAAWGRQKYPGVFQGALASSAPVEVKADFQEYDTMVGLAFGDNCHSTVNQLMRYLDDLYSLGKLDDVKAEVKCTRVHDDILFLYTLADAVSSIVQTNDVNYSPNINELCSAVSQPVNIPEKLSRLLEILSSFFRTRGTTCYGFTGISDLKALSHNQDSFFRQWTYQSCQEFGYWQTASAYPVRSKHLTVDWFSNFYCKPPFFTPAIGPPNTYAINSEHRGKQIDTTNILFTNGQFDPWSALSNTNRNAIVIANASHVSDLGPADPSDSPPCPCQANHQAHLPLLDQPI